MSNVIIDREKIDILANAISDKSGVPVTMTLAEMVEAVDSIETGGGEPNLQAKTYTVDSAGTATVTADSGYDGLSSVAVSVPSAEYLTGLDGVHYYTDNNVRKWRVRGKTELDTGEGDVEGWLSEGTNYGEYEVYNAIAQNTTVTPTESAQTIGGANTMMEGAVTVNAIPSNYVGSGITQRSSSDLTASGDTVIVPSGYYSTQASKIVASMTLPSETSSTNIGVIQASVIPSTSPRYINIPTGYNSVAKYYYLSPMELAPLSVSENGTYNASDPYDVHGFSSVTVSVPTGTARTSSDLTVSGATVTVPAGLYSEQATKSVASGTAGTPTATKGTVSNHSVSVTPSVTNTTGYITGSTKTGTAVTVSASELVSGTYTVSASGTHDVINYASASVASGSATAPASISGTSASITTGTNTITLTKTVSVTPSVSAGYVSSGTAGNSSVSLTASVTTKAAATITPTTTNQTIAAGTYLTGIQTIAGDADLVGSNILSTANIFGVQGTVDFIDVYIRSAAPTSSVGNDGDIYIQE